MTDYLTVSMYFDGVTASRYFSGASVGINNQDFSGHVVPFAPESQGDQIALKKFARAHKARFATGPPVLLLTIKIPAKFALQHILAREIKVMENRPEETVGFARPVNASNYPSMMAEVTQIHVQDEQDTLLQAGYELLP